MVVERGIHRLDREAYNFLLFHPGHAQSRRFGFAPCGDRCKIIAMALFSITRVISLPSGWLLALKALSVATTTKCNDRKSTG